ncbi:MAG TPA: hypothetical protein VEG65_05835 [Candidatus Bathyarchaeia archaeon]|nr:hypothetical protein [Candidatus Bathyarchaeia archaeon]
MTDKEEFILSELKRLQREIDVLNEVYAHYLEEGLKREERTMQEMDRMRARIEKTASTSEMLLKRNEDLLEEIKKNQERILHR